MRADFRRKEPEAKVNECVIIGDKEKKHSLYFVLLF